MEKPGYKPFSESIFFYLKKNFELILLVTQVKFKAILLLKVFSQHFGFYKVKNEYLRGEH